MKSLKELIKKAKTVNIQAKFLGFKDHIGAMSYLKGEIKMDKNEFFIVDNGRGGTLCLGCPICGEMHIIDTQVMVGSKISIMNSIKTRCCDWEGFLLLNELVRKDDNNQHGTIPGNSEILSETQKIS